MIKYADSNPIRAAFFLVPLQLDLSPRAIALRYVTHADSRLALLQEWLDAQLAGAPYGIAPASSDASFRRYFRVSANGRTTIAMDAPPPKENCRPFVAVARLLREAGVNAPEILAEDLDRGFLLLSDLGSTT